MRSMQTTLPVLAAVLAPLLGACASPAGRAPTPDPARDCRQLETERSELGAARREAQERKASAWQAIVPFAVAGRVASANSALRETGQRLAALDDEARRLGCDATS